MATDFADLVARLRLRPGASAAALLKLQSGLGTQLPGDYLSFLSRSNGAEGLVGDFFLRLWSAEEILGFYEAVEASEAGLELLPALRSFLLIGSDGGEEWYAFDRRQDPMPVVRVCWETLGSEEPAAMGQTFTHFLEYMHSQPSQDVPLPNKPGEASKWWDRQLERLRRSKLI